MKNINKQILNRYYLLQSLRVKNKITSQETEELLNICSILFDTLLKNNTELFKRMKVSDYDNTQAKELIKKLSH